MKEKSKSYKICKWIYKPLLKLLYKPTVEGLENVPKNEKIILAGNHKHAYDPIVVMSFIDRQIHFMAKEELFKGLRGAILDEIGMIKVFREDKTKNASSMLKAEEILEKQGVIGVFPEGTRNRTNQKLLNFRKGAVKLAQKTDTNIVPFAIKGKYRLFGNELKLVFGAPINVSQMDLEIANGHLQKEVERLL